VNPTRRRNDDYPPSSRAIRLSRSVAAAYFTGSLIGAALVGSLFGVLAFVLPTEGMTPVTSLVLVSVAILLGLRELGLLRLRLPQRESQVNFDALAGTSVHRRMFSFGFWLGTGFLTYSPYAGLHAIALAVLLQGQFMSSLVIFLAFGAARAATVVTLGMTARTWEDAASLGDRVAGSYQKAHRLTAAGLALVAIVSTFTLLG
jgi:hypothetical protein